MPIYLLNGYRLWFSETLAIGCVAAVCHILAQSIPWVGVMMPIFSPVLATALVAPVSAWQSAAALACIAGSICTLIRADLLNLGSIEAMLAPIASIGGAGMFDGVFLTSIWRSFWPASRNGPEADGAFTRHRI